MRGDKITKSLDLPEFRQGPVQSSEASAASYQKGRNYIAKAARSDKGGLGLRPTEILAKSQSGPYGKIQVLSQKIS